MTEQQESKEEYQKKLKAGTYYIGSDSHISEKMRYDKRQTILTSNGIAENPFYLAEKKKSYTVFDTRLVLCPFCLKSNEINMFLIMTKKGEIHKLLGKCPNCSNEMQLNTLDELTVMSIKDLAYWVFQYRLSGFWGKVTRNEPKGSTLGEMYFKEFCDNLYRLTDDKGEGGKEFWDYYRSFKGEGEKDETNKSM